ncbi:MULTISPECIES: hypothetical protein [Methylomonas]|nr:MULTISPECIES: hypothetical protein [Methylomonas]
MSVNERVKDIENSLIRLIEDAEDGLTSHIKDVENDLARGQVILLNQVELSKVTLREFKRAICELKSEIVVEQRRNQEKQIEMTAAITLLTEEVKRLTDAVDQRIHSVNQIK